jgi:hypothetical protein
VFSFVLKLPFGRFLQPARMNPFGRAEISMPRRYDETMSTLKIIEKNE